ncbi:primary-amine oxidase [Cladophialophora yegresii CBS 114405]|uniref:Amine oxidase n=1 Tax=Cladophialophora yegresii CBS 114405 TaxID=1182544 RepID=W9W994_9EURO|nr:primary-amine oxidase [Cladophialophora yegresii CBS 114405]EXJ61101.1 primary-amine oxidase [Cladophialophora yegresii CBS 114405]
MTATNGHTVPKRVYKHPLDQLSVDEVNTARQAVLDARKAAVIFRNTFAVEPAKAELVKFLNAEHAGTLSADTPRPARQARVQYDVVSEDRSHEYMESVIDIASGKEVEHRQIPRTSQQALTVDEFKEFSHVCVESDMFKKAVKELNLDEKFEIAIDPWPYGGPDVGEVTPRYTQGLCFAKLRNGNPDSNHYGFPLPIIPVMDTYKKEIIRIDRLATGGVEDGLSYGTAGKNVLEHCQPAEYVPELLDTPLRSDLKPLNVLQPEGPTFTVSDDSLIEWQKWRFRVGFTPRECAVLHDVHYDGRSVLYRLSLSEMTVPYGDPRPPFHRKQAFDFGDAGAGRAANNLALGCDCLGVIKYIDAMLVDTEGKPSVSKNVVCVHEQDNGIGWKHTNFRTNRAVVTRSRELVVQFIITLANYEYIFAYKFDQAGGITVETRATGIVSVVNIDPGKTSPYGNVVSPGALAQNHQHIFAVRIDPAIDGHNNTIFTEESLPIPMNPKTNPHGNGYDVVRKPVTKSTSIHASPFTNLTIKMANASKINPISQRPVSYKFIPSPSQLILADPDSIVAKRAAFAHHHVWVTKYKDNELFAGGEFTNQSQKEEGGVADMVARKDEVENEDVVVWNVFGLTHNPRVEDWPVMPVEIHQLHLRPADFFERNPALDVPGNKNLASVEVGRDANGDCCQSNGNGSVQADPTSHLQGSESIPVASVNGH